MLALLQDSSFQYPCWHQSNFIFRDCDLNTAFAFFDQGLAICKQGQGDTSWGELTSTEHPININIARSTQGPQDWADRTAFSIFVVILRRQCWLGFSASIGDYQKFKLESIAITLTKMQLQNFDQTSTLKSQIQLQNLNQKPDWSRCNWSFYQ